MKKFIASPAPYLIWALIVAASLFGASFAHPHIFGFTTLTVSLLTGAVGVAGVGTCLFSEGPEPRDRAIIVAALIFAAAAIATAFHVLGTYNWA